MANLLRRLPSLRQLSPPECSQKIPRSFPAASGYSSLRKGFACSARSDLSPLLQLGQSARHEAQLILHHFSRPPPCSQACITADPTSTVFRFGPLTPSDNQLQPLKVLECLSRAQGPGARPSANRRPSAEHWNAPRRGFGAAFSGWPPRAWLITGSLDPSLLV